MMGADVGGQRKAAPHDCQTLGEVVADAFEKKVVVCRRAGHTAAPAH
jgi:hypothetical protein